MIFEDVVGCPYNCEDPQSAAVASNTAALDLRLIFSFVS